MKVLPIQSYEAEPWLLKKHYAKRFPPISFAFGLYEETVLVGVCTYGMPSSATLREGIAGAENAKFVLELNRLCIESNNKNAASFLVGRSLRLLPKPSIIESLFLKYTSSSLEFINFAPHVKSLNLYSSLLFS